MSQFFQGVTAGSLPPSVPTSFVTQSGTAVPLANILLLNAYDSTENNTNGIATKGGVNAGDPPGSGATNEADIYLTNRLQGSVSTVGVQTQTIATMALSATPGNYAFNVNACGYTATGPAGTAYSILACIRTDGATATLVSTSDETFVEDASLGASDVQVTVSGNNIVVNAIGIAGITIDWSIVSTYVFIG